MKRWICFAALGLIVALCLSAESLAQKKEETKKNQHQYGSVELGSETGEFKEQSGGPVCFYGFYTISITPVGAFACINKQGNAIYAYEGPSEVLSREVKLRLVGWGELFGEQGWVYEEKEGKPAWQWFFTRPADGLAGQRVSKSPGVWSKRITVRAVKFGE
jgi:hypothetical protein